MASEPFSKALGDPSALEALRRTVVDDVSTYRGFRRRVKLTVVLQVAGLLLPSMLLLLAFAVHGTWSTLGSDDRFVGSSAMRVDVAAVLALAVLRVWSPPPGGGWGGGGGNG